VGRLVIAMLWGVLFYLLWKMFFPSRPKLGGRDHPEKQTESMVQDPNCETFIPQARALRKTIRGETHYFCSKECLQAYRDKSKS
jgi:YHS domain-containing protein